MQFIALVDAIVCRELSLIAVEQVQKLGITPNKESHKDIIVGERVDLVKSALGSTQSLFIAECSQQPMQLSRSRWEPVQDIILRVPGHRAGQDTLYEHSSKSSNITH